MFVLVITRLGALFINHLRHLADPLRERRLGDPNVPPAAVFVHHGLRQHFNINQSADRFATGGVQRVAQFVQGSDAPGFAAVAGGDGGEVHRHQAAL